jgi:hypothetical protein
MDAWLRPLLQWIFAPRQSFWKKVLTWPVREIGKGLKAVMRYVSAILGGAFFLAGAALARYFNAARWLEDLLTLGLERAFTAYWNGLVYLREVAIPKLINVVLTPVREAANLAKALATAATTTLTQISVTLAEGLRFLPGSVPVGIIARFAYFVNAFHDLWDKVWQNIAPRLDHLTKTVIPKLTARVDDLYDDLYRTGANSLPRLRDRLKVLEGKLAGIGTLDWWQTGVLAAIAALAGVAVASVGVGLRALFCRNTQNVARKVCAMDEALLAGLLAGTLTFALLLDPKLVARTGQEIEGVIEGAFRSMADL